MSTRRTLLASLPILLAGVAALAAATNGFRAFTSETARHLSIVAQARPLPSVALQTAEGQTVSLAQLRGRWLLVDFIYTRCEIYCSVQGNEFARLQQRLAGPISAGQVTLLSISFDPGHDGPRQLQAYQRRSGDRGTGWVAARPLQAADLALLLRTFGVVVVPDRLGGYVHNAAIAIVDPRGRLVRIVDWDAHEEAEAWVRQRIAS